MTGSGDRPLRRLRHLIAPGALVAVAALLVAPLPSGFLGIWQAQLLDFGHVPLFAALVVALRVGWGPPLYRALGLALAVAGLAEVVQPWVGRTGDWSDFLRGALGALAGAAAVRGCEARRSRLRLAGYATLALALVAWPVVEIAPYVADTVEGVRAFPVLADCSTDRELLRWQCEQATLTRDADGARLDLLAGPDVFPRAALRLAVSDFRGYRRLCCAFRVVGEPVDLVISVRTGAEGGGSTHAQVGRRYEDGDHVVRLDLAALSARARPRPLDLADVRYLQFFTVRPPATRTVVLNRIWLEP